MFRSHTVPKNFVMEFDNGYSVSMAMGHGTYCSESDDGYTTIECAVIGPNDKFYRMPDWDDDVRGWMTADQVADLLNEVRKL